MEFQESNALLQVNTANADGSDSKVQVPKTAFEESSHWSPGGKRIALVSTRDGGRDV